MPQSTRRVDLRMTISAAAPYRAIAVELAGKYAEYAGASPAAAHQFAQEMSAALAPVADAQPGTSIEIEIGSADGTLAATANAGTATPLATCPLPD